MADFKDFIAENIRTPVTASDGDIIETAKKKLRFVRGIGRIVSAEIYKRSVDARKRSDITFVSSVEFRAEAGDVDVEYLASKGVKIKTDETVSFIPGKEKCAARPVVIGFGPAGMFASLYLAKYGYRPIVLERGGAVDERIEAVKRFKSGGALDTETNVQFGAGGAGTFSDGKLTTRIGDPYVREVLRTFADLGAPETVTKRAKPHIGTDVLCEVVKNFHDRIISLGGEIRYNTLVTEIGDGYVVANGDAIPCSASVLAIGHSARDLYEKMYSSFAMEVKPFSVGVRIEHLTRDIDRAMYGDEALSDVLGHAEYALSHRKGERGVYTFCMCPGGEVIAAASEDGGVVTNGMSNSLRDGVNSNAAIAVSVLPSDVSADPMAAIEYQRRLERDAFRLGGMTYAAPCETVGDFLDGARGRGISRVKPTYRCGDVRQADLSALFPEYISSMLKEGIVLFGKKIKGFDAPDAVLTGVESRTSSPVRILRGDDYVALGKKAVYPCGEGAGYAGGIVSAAVDGIRVAGAVISRFSNEF